MHAFEPTCVGQITQITANSLDSDLKPLGKVVNGDFAFDSGGFENVMLAKVLWHVRLGSNSV